MARAIERFYLALMGGDRVAAQTIAENPVFAAFASRFNPYTLIFTRRKSGGGGGGGPYAILMGVVILVGLLLLPWTLGISALIMLPILERLAAAGSAQRLSEPFLPPGANKVVSNSGFYEVISRDLWMSGVSGRDYYRAQYTESRLSHILLLILMISAACIIVSCVQFVIYWYEGSWSIPEMAWQYWVATVVLALAMLRYLVAYMRETMVSDLRLAQRRHMGGPNVRRLMRVSGEYVLLTIVTVAGVAVIITIRLIVAEMAPDTGEEPHQMLYNLITMGAIALYIYLMARYVERVTDISVAAMDENADRAWEMYIRKRVESDPDA